MAARVESFQQKRIVDLSKELDAQRDKAARLTRDTIFLNQRLKQSQQEIEKLKEKLLENQIQTHKLTEYNTELTHQNLQLKDGIERQINLRSQAEVQNVRQRQKIDELKTEMFEYQNRMKATLFECSGQLAQKQKIIMKLRDENIEVEKLYLNKRQQTTILNQKRLREMAKVLQELQLLRKELNTYKTSIEKQIIFDKNKWKQQIQEMQAQIDELEIKIRDREAMKQEIVKLKGKVEEVVIENSQKIIELYKLKYLKDI